MVLGEDVAANLRDRAEGRVRPRPDEDGRAVDLTVEWPAADGEVHRARGRREVGVHEVRQGVGEAEEIGSGDRCVARDLALEDEVGLMNLRQLEVGSEVLHGGRDKRPRSQKVRVAGGRRVAGRDSHLTLRHVNADARVDERVVDGRVNDATVVESPAAAQAGLAVARDVVGEAEARAPVVLVRDAVGRLRQRGVDARGDVGRVLLVLVAHAEVQRETRVNAPLVLEEEVEIGRLHRQAEDA